MCTDIKWMTQGFNPDMATSQFYSTSTRILFVIDEIILRL